MRVSLLFETVSRHCTLLITTAWRHRQPEAIVNPEVGRAARDTWRIAQELGIWLSDGRITIRHDGSEEPNHWWDLHWPCTVRGLLLETANSFFRILSERNTIIIVFYWFLWPKYSCKSTRQSGASNDSDSVHSHSKNFSLLYYYIIFTISLSEQ